MRKWQRNPEVPSGWAGARPRREGPPGTDVHVKECVRELLAPGGALSIGKAGFDVVAFHHRAFCASEDIEGRALRRAGALTPHAPAGI